jgi:hypothetical protein
MDIPTMVVPRERLTMPEPESSVDFLVVWGVQVDIERGYRLEAIAVQLSDDIASLCENRGPIPPRPHPHHRATPAARPGDPGRGLSVETGQQLAD